MKSKFLLCSEMNDIYQSPLQLGLAVFVKLRAIKCVWKSYMSLQFYPWILSYASSHPPYLPLAVVGWRKFEMLSLKIREAWNPELLLKESHSDLKGLAGGKHKQTHACMLNKKLASTIWRNKQKLVHPDRYRIIEPLVVRLNRWTWVGYDLSVFAISPLIRGRGFLFFLCQWV